MNLKQLQYFISIAESGSFSEASRRLYIAQPSLTRQIRQLEEHLGASLFERYSTGVTLTEAGKVFYDDVSRIFGQLETAREKVAQITEGTQGVLELGTTALHLRTQQISDALKHFRQQYPDIKLRVNAMLASNQIDYLFQRRLHAGIMYYPPESPLIESMTINQDRLVLVTHVESDLAKKPAQHLKDLEPYNFIWFDRSASEPFYDVVFSYFGEKGFQPSLLETGNTSATIMSLVSSDQGYTFMPEKVMEGLAEPVVYYSLEDLNIPLELKMVWLKGNRTQQINNLIDSIEVE
ncbi:LysR family transcriptional regulator [Marinomonas algicola]|uniref:LysR family transcriptional regulator n=1 Tax=Marinomonas algicola TaxID=2773454 RepID=UPI00174E963B|nr:LysR family transcriptional regulator [Marinomonas algicola]